MAFVYIVKCDDGSLYTGITNDISKRMKNHCGKACTGHAKYMRSHTPVELCALWETTEYKNAAKLEYAIKKKLSRQKKLELIENPGEVSTFFEHLSEYEFTPVSGISLETCLGINT